MKKTIMFYINSLNRGGAERVILRLAHHFAVANYRSIVVTSFVDKNEYPVPDGVERISLEQDQIKQSRIKKNIARIKGLRKKVKEIKPDVLISFMCEPNFRAICASVGLRTKRIVSVRNDPNKEYGGKLGRLVGKVLLPFADGCVFQTKDAQDWFPKRLRNKSTIILNEVDEKFFNVEYKGGKHIVTVGRLNEQKNQLMLIRAFSKIANDYPEWDLQIWGTGVLEKELNDEIERLGMKEKIFLKGLTTDVPSVLANAGIFVLSSDYEGMPNALMEALAVGVPSISTDCPCGGPKMLIENGKNGFLVPLRDENMLIEYMKKLITDEMLAKNVQEEAVRRSKQFSPDRIFSQWKGYIDDFIG